MIEMTYWAVMRFDSHNLTSGRLPWRLRRTDENVYRCETFLAPSTLTGGPLAFGEGRVQVFPNKSHMHFNYLWVSQNSYYDNQQSDIWHYMCVFAPCVCNVCACVCMCVNLLLPSLWLTDPSCVVMETSLSLHESLYLESRLIMWPHSYMTRFNC